MIATILLAEKVHGFSAFYDVLILGVAREERSSCAPSPAMYLIR